MDKKEEGRRGTELEGGRKGVRVCERKRRRGEKREREGQNQPTRPEPTHSKKKSEQAKAKYTSINAIYLAMAPSNLPSNPLLFAGATSLARATDSPQDRETQSDREKREEKNELSALN